MTSPEAPISRYQLCHDAVAWRDVDGEVVALDLSSGEYVTLNGAGRLLWLALDEPVSVDDLAQLLVTSFGISREQGIADCLTFLSDLEGRSLVASAE